MHAPYEEGRTDGHQPSMESIYLLVLRRSFIYLSFRLSHPVFCIDVDAGRCPASWRNTCVHNRENNKRKKPSFFSPALKRELGFCTYKKELRRYNKICLPPLSQAASPSCQMSSFSSLSDIHFFFLCSDNLNKTAGQN